MERQILDEPSLQGIDPGTPEWFAQQRRLIEQRPLVKRCYDLWYRLQADDARNVPGDGPVVELGSGSSYLNEYVPDLIRSDVQEGIVERVIDARDLPFEDSSVRAILMSHVFHHIPDIPRFLREAERVLVPGGVISMVDVTHTPLARFFFDRFHPEPYDDRMREWAFDQTHQMMDSNQALTWIVFDRDRKRFENEHRSLKLEERKYLPWLGYMLSGGLTRRSVIPSFLAPPLRLLEDALSFSHPLFALHWYLRLRKTGGR
jgi:SAM-dependent methyltransferase